MSIEQLDVIDFCSIDHDGNFVLTISDHFKWDKEMEHIYMLQEKINTYLAGLESGEVYTKYPLGIGRNVVINVVCLHEIDHDNKQIFAKFQHWIHDAGYSLTLTHMPVADLD